MAKTRKVSEKYNYRWIKDWALMLLIALAGMVATLTILCLFFPELTTPRPIYVEQPTPSPLNVEEFNRRDCQLALDQYNEVKVYCKED